RPPVHLEVRGSQAPVMISGRCHLSRSAAGVLPGGRSQRTSSGVVEPGVAEGTAHPLEIAMLGVDFHRDTLKEPATVTSTASRLSRLASYGMVRAMASELRYVGTSGRLSRRDLMRWAGAALAGAAAGTGRACAAPADKAAPGRDPDEILRGLMAGNERFA